MSELKSGIWGKSAYHLSYDHGYHLLDSFLPVFFLHEEVGIK